MTPEAQRIAIAEACGYGDYGTRTLGWDDSEIASLPDYLNDLNAMHEALRLFNDEQQILFIRHLVGSEWLYNAVMAMDKTRTDDKEEFITNHLHSLGWDEVWSFVLMATPSKLAEAFLRTIGKWAEDSGK